MYLSGGTQQQQVVGELADVAVVGVALRLGLQRGELLATRNYREFCHRYFDGRFLEHIPEIERKYDGSVRRTAEVIEANGFQIDWPLWEKDFTKCTPCHPGSDCH